MATAYAIYRNDGAGGPVDTATPIGTTSGLTFDDGPLADGTDATYLVRAYDDVTLESELNTDAMTRVIVESGQDVSGRPGPPAAIFARATAGGGCRVTWTYAPARTAATPAGFKVWLTAGTTVNYAAPPAATVPYVPGRAQYAVDLSGLADEAQYAVGVRAYTASAVEPNTLSALVEGESVGPDAPDDLTATEVVADA